MAQWPQLSFIGNDIIQDTNSVFISRDTFSLSIDKYGSCCRDTVWFINSGNEPLILDVINGTEPCIASARSKNPILPGEKGFMVLNCPFAMRLDETRKKTFFIRSNILGAMTLLRIEWYYVE